MGSTETQLIVDIICREAANTHDVKPMVCRYCVHLRKVFFCLLANI